MLISSSIGITAISTMKYSPNLSLILSFHSRYSANDTLASFWHLSPTAAGSRSSMVCLGFSMADTGVASMLTSLARRYNAVSL